MILAFVIWRQHGPNMPNVNCIPEVHARSGAGPRRAPPSVPPDCTRHRPSSHGEVDIPASTPTDTLQPKALDDATGMSDHADTVTLDQMKAAVGSLLFLWSDIERALRAAFATELFAGNRKSVHLISQALHVWSKRVMPRGEDRPLQRELCQRLHDLLKDALLVRNLVCHSLIGYSAQPPLPDPRGSSPCCDRRGYAGAHVERAAGDVSVDGTQPMAHRRPHSRGYGEGCRNQRGSAARMGGVPRAAMTAASYSACGIIELPRSAPHLPECLRTLKDLRRLSSAM